MFGRLFLEACQHASVKEGDAHRHLIHHGRREAENELANRPQGQKNRVIQNSEANVVIYTRYYPLLPSMYGRKMSGLVVAAATMPLHESRHRQKMEGQRDKSYLR